MTLREKNHEPTTSVQRKYSVSQSGKYKSRPKIRPSLGDLFQPEATGAASGSANHFGTITTDDTANRTGSGRGQHNMTSSTSNSGTAGTITTVTQQSSRGVYETAL